MMDITREDPPGSRSTTSREHLAIAEKLKADPGNWYKIAEGHKTHQLATNVTRGVIMAYRPAGAFEATSRKLENGIAIYVRYVGETS